METQKFDLARFQPKKSTLVQDISKVQLSRVIGYSDINEFQLFIAYNNDVPNYILLDDIDCEKANQEFLNLYESQIKNVYYNKRFLQSYAMPEYDDIFYFLFDDVLIYFNINKNYVRLLFRNTDTKDVEALSSLVQKFYLKPILFKQPEIRVLFQGHKHLETETLKIIKPRLSIKDNYNDDFLPIHNIIYNKLRKKNNKGLVLLHGRPGTGKTSYIRYLIAKVKKEVIFLPPNMASIITNPDILPTLIRKPDTIFVIEDAENIVVDRQRNGYSPVSALLNISDGLLSDCLNIQIICTFNTDISRVDNALLRKGRLIAKYEFKELEVSKAQALSNKLGYNTVITQPVTLATIYNQPDKDFSEEKRNTIGFKVA